MEYTVSNQPNAGKLISSLRNTGYDSYSAIEDIIDNSIDAQARKISIYIETIKGERRLMIADNGTGMTQSTLDEALRLWSISDKTEVSDLWKYGMGLCTASISISKRLEVITQERKWIFWYSCQDLDEVIEKNEFMKTLRPANPMEIGEFRRLIDAETGTLIVLTKIDRLSDGNISQFWKTLGGGIGRKFRKFIDSGIYISINEKLVPSIDPLMLDEKETEMYSDEKYELPLSITWGRKEEIRVKLVILPDYSKEIKEEKGMGVKNQGFYIMRNNREIDKAKTLWLFTKDPHLNRFRGELSFNASLDDIFGVRFSKDGVSPNAELKAFLEKELRGQIAAIRTRADRARKSSPESQVDHSESEEIIAQKSKLLITPESRIEKRAEHTRENDNNPSEVLPTMPSYARENFKEAKTSPRWLGARFESASMWKEWVLYECEQAGKIIVIRWNTDHPFYERVVLENRDNKDITTGIDYLIYSLASAELKSMNDDNVELLYTIKTIMSSNLRSLLI